MLTIIFTLLAYLSCVAGYWNSTTRIGMVLYPKFEQLDVVGPHTIFSFAKVFLMAEKRGLVRSRIGTQWQVDHDFQNHPEFDVLFVPGGLVDDELANPAILEFIETQAKKAKVVLTVCTGSVLLAKTGLLDGSRATTNKMAWKKFTPQFPDVNWVKHARWVQDGKYITSSGVSAGTDMAAYFVKKYFGEQTLNNSLKVAEYIWNSNPDYDPFSGSADE
ncbi:class I glutamine amidotransferase-like protein [Basidiobolus meristosporus CBS 931.73]|uniref:Class I glutamine amidotransferase-like protein n=1 Tax=Basidiobolus meristosporus CBS 931.73 TaxID=1314790 RepID=A0A1Y1XQC6_9FUNG|nr:class I glutamine amidotransferase-like protein [Basidiobolus meristosporus CBS 931.73]|eukprot:ORX87524.1 class I glutamine amidotransferase-like protein [Basidiobolus meristosporus CBS 931.73]